MLADGDKSDISRGLVRGGANTQVEKKHSGTWQALVHQQRFLGCLEAQGIEVSGGTTLTSAAYAGAW